MEPRIRSDAKGDHLNDSWVELNLNQQQSSSNQMTPQQLTPPIGPHSLSKPISSGTMEKLLLEAQKEWSRTSSRIGSNVGSQASSRGSPKSPRSPSNELTSIGLGDMSPVQEARVLPQEVGTDWIWDWSSRPEALPPGDMNGSKFKHPRRIPLSIRNTKVMRSGPFSMENLPIMLFTHACTFFLGAAVVFAYLKKYCGWSSVITTTVVTTTVD